MTENDRKAIGYLGFAARAGRVAVGVPMVCEAMKKNKAKSAPFIVIEAADTSANTHKRITDRTSYYGVRSIRLEADGDTLATAVGKHGATVAVVGVLEPNLATAIAVLYGITL